jgi:hypothetical protein
MLTDAEKVVIAKKNLESFFKRVTSKEYVTEGIEYTYLYFADGSFNIDYYWSDHVITPTGFYRYISRYNSTTKPRNKWITEIRLSPFLYEELTSRLTNSSGQLIISGVLINKG